MCGAQTGRIRSSSDVGGVYCSIPFQNTEGCFQVVTVHLLAGTVPIFYHLIIN